MLGGFGVLVPWSEAQNDISFIFPHIPSPLFYSRTIFYYVVSQIAVMVCQGCVLLFFCLEVVLFEETRVSLRRMDHIYGITEDLGTGAFQVLNADISTVVRMTTMSSIGHGLTNLGVYRTSLARA